MLKNNLEINISKKFLFCICVICLIFTSCGISIEDSAAVELNENACEMESDIDIQLENSQTNDLLEADNQEQDVLSTVRTVSGNKYENIETAIDNANPGDTIKLSGTYYASNDQSCIYLKKSLHFDGSGTAVMDGKGLSNAFRLLEGSEGTTFKGIKFINGNSHSGSAIHIRTKNILVEDCVFEKNHCNRGGAVYTAAVLDMVQNVVVRNCRFKENSAYLKEYDEESSSPALSVYGRNSLVTNCIFESNYVKSNIACYGGAIQAGLDEPGSNVVVSNCIFINNKAISAQDRSHGGAGCVRNGTSYINCTFINNFASQGGALTFHASGFISNCTFINNSASQFGGALSTGYLYDTMTMTVGNCIFEGNSAPDGGAIQAIGLNINVVDSNFTDNRASNCGGAINIIAQNVKVDNDDFKGNIADVNGGAIYVNGENTAILKSSFISNHAIPDSTRLDDGLGGAIYVKSPVTNIMLNNFEYNTARNGSAIYYDENGEELTLMSNILFENQAWVYQLPIYTEDIYYEDSEDIKVVLFGGNNIGKYNNLAVSNAIYNAANFDKIDIDSESPISGATDDGRLYQDGREYNMHVLLTVTGEDGTVIYNGSSNTSYLGEINVQLDDLKPGKYFVTAQHFEDTYYKGITNVTSFRVNPKVDNKITISTTSPSFDFEDVVVWTVNITNFGPNNSTGVIAYNVIPEGLILLNHTFGDRYDPKTGMLNLSELNAGETLTYTVITVVDRTGDIVNEVNITANEFDVNMDNNFDEAIISVDPSSDIAVVKTASSSSPNYLDYFNWTITVTNNGPDTAHNVTVTDVLPSSHICIGCDGDWDEDTGIWNIGTLENGHSVKLTIQCQVIKTGLAQNNVSASASEFDYDLTNNHDEERIYTNPSSDLSIKKDVNASNVNYLDFVKWTLTITNNGPDDAYNVIVRDVLPEGFVYVGSAVGYEDHSSSEIIRDVLREGFIYVDSALDYVDNAFAIDKINAGETIVIELVCQVNITGEFVNTANVTSDNYDYDLTNNEDDEAITVNPASDLSVSKSVDESDPQYHDTVTWTIEVRNNGPDTAHNILVKDLLPDSLVWLSDDGMGKYNPVTGELTLESLDVDDEFTLNIECMVNATGLIQNNVSVKSDEYDHNMSNNEDNETIEVEKSADVSIVKLVSNTSPNYRQLVTWTLVISNSGPDRASNVYVEDALPEGLVLVNYTATKGFYDNGMWAMCCLEKGEEQRLEIITLVNRTGRITNLVAIRADEYDSNMANNQDNESVDVPLSVDVEVTVEVNNTGPLYGESVKWTVTVKNNGPDDATNVVLDEIIPDELLFVDYDSTKGIYSDGQWNIGSLEVGEEQTLKLTTIPYALGQIQNAADVGCSEYDWNMSNNHDEESLDVKPVADLSVTKLVDNPAPNYGETVTWTIVISNEGPNAATNVMVYDALPKGLTFIRSNGDYRDGVWKVGNLDVDEYRELIIVCRVNATGSISNHAEITSDEHDPDMANNHDDEMIDVPPASDLSVTKTASKYSYHVGDVIEYTIEIVNNGPDTARNIKVSEILDDLLKIKSFKASMGKFTKKSLVWSIDSLANGQSAKLLIKAIATGSGILNNSVSVTSDTFDPDLENNDDFAVVNVTEKPSNDLSGALKNQNKQSDKTPFVDLQKHPTANPFWSLIVALVFSLIFVDARILKR